MSQLKIVSRLSLSLYASVRGRVSWLSLSWD